MFIRKNSRDGSQVQPPGGPRERDEGNDRIVHCQGDGTTGSKVRRGGHSSLKVDVLKLRICLPCDQLGVVPILLSCDGGVSACTRGKQLAKPAQFRDSIDLGAQKRQDSVCLIRSVCLRDSAEREVVDLSFARARVWRSNEKSAAHRCQGKAKLAPVLQPGAWFGSRAVNSSYASAVERQQGVVDDEATRLGRMRADQLCRCCRLP